MSSFSRLTFIAVLALLLSACASEPSKFYVLNPISIASSTHTKINYRVGLEKIQLAEYLQQPQIITRKSAHELRLDEFNRWAEPLRQNIQSVLKTNVQHLLKHALVLNYPWKRSADIQYFVTVNITKFEANLNGRCLLQTNYAIEGKGKKIISAANNLRFLTHVNPNSYNSIVAGMNRNLNSLSKVLARKLSKKHNQKHAFQKSHGSNTKSLPK